MRSRKRFVRRSSPRKSYFRLHKRSKSKGSSTKLLQFDAMAYGAVRGYVSNLISPLTSKIPLGSIADEVGMGIINYYVAKNTSGMIKDIAVKGLVIENAFVGNAIAQGGLNLLGGNSSSSSSVTLI